MSESKTQKSVKLADGAVIPAIGQGTWFMGEDPAKEMDEISSLQLGVELGMTLIDTAEMYANGGAELIVGKAIKHIRDKVFLVSKVYPHNAGKNSAVSACENSLKRLQADYLDLYLLHWRGSIPLSETIEVMEKLKMAGKIRRWGVSNFDTDDMKQLYQITNGQDCSVNQVLYHIGSRGIEYDLMPWCRDHKIPIMAYCPIAQGGTLRKDLINNNVIQDLAKTKQCTPIQLLLAWCIRDGNVIAIPKSSNKTHILENAQASTIIFNQHELDLLNSTFNPPKHKINLDVI